ncbi:hypothetical protein EYF80_055413 [Liparis tanakae]|uniref:Uncharacterized protein n=1 Tax=Liparis tanakae TaxID=230148 RepID=A0A4Z2F194_9TELE|nr:hypothetical protein EYF80_055413 [Liparis tanakae]
MSLEAPPPLRPAPYAQLAFPRFPSEGCVPVEEALPCLKPSVQQGGGLQAGSTSLPEALGPAGRRPTGRKHFPVCSPRSSRAEAYRSDRTSNDEREGGLGRPEPPTI